MSREPKNSDVSVIPHEDIPSVAARKEQTICNLRYT